MIGHTPGPWEYSAACDDRHAVVSPPCDGEVDIGPWFTAIVSCADAGVETANACLMAAAPELLAALELFVEAEKLARDGMAPQGADRLIEMGEAAISFAKGSPA